MTQAYSKSVTEQNTHATFDVRSTAAVLVVEDDPHLRSLYSDALRLMGGLAVVAVDDGYAALSYLEANRASAVVLDIGLPRVSGFDVQHELAAHGATADIPIVVVTGSDTVLNPAQYDCVLRKPIDVAELVAAVRRCLSETGKK